MSAAITEPNCATANCHGRGSAAAGLDFSSPERGFISLTGLWVWIVDPNGTPEQGCRVVAGGTVCQREHRSLLVPFDPSQSRLVAMLRARNARRMPPEGSLPDVDIRLIEIWILGGASNDRASLVDPQIEPQSIGPRTEVRVGASEVPDAAGNDTPSFDEGPGG